MAVISFGNPQNPQFSIFHASTSAWQPLATTVKAAAWSPDGTKIAYLEENGDTTVLYISAVDGSQKKKILDLHIIDVKINWVSEKNILITQKPSASFIGSIWLVDISKATLEHVTAGRGLDLAASQQGGLLFSNQLQTIQMTAPDAKSTLSTLPFITLPEKCVIDATYVYCATPQNLNLKEINELPDAYFKKQLYTADDIFKYDIINNSMEPIFNSEEITIDAVNLVPHNGNLFFINRYDGLIYSIKLK
jgi:hypothetical protein